MTLIALALALTQPPPAASISRIPATLRVGPGPLTMSANGRTVTVTDATGSGAGWQVLASASGGTAELDGFTAACGPLTRECPASSLSYPIQVTSGAPVPVLQALRLSGMGVTSYLLQWSASPGNAAEPVTITLSVQSGP